MAEIKTGSRVKLNVENLKLQSKFFSLAFLEFITKNRKKVFVVEGTEKGFFRLTGVDPWLFSEADLISSNRNAARRAGKETKK